jgi:uncharacterized membrane protein
MTTLLISHIPAGSPQWIFTAAIAAVFLHIGAGSIGILAGYAAIVVRKGESLHRLFGTLFFASMLTMTTMATGLAVFLREMGNIAGGTLAFYLVATAWVTVRRPEESIGSFEKAAFVVVLATAGALLLWGLEAANSPTRLFQGAPPALYYVFSAFAAFVAFLDFRVIRRGGVSGVQRVARHLWRMTFALFFAAASFFIGQQKVMPAFLHGSPTLYVLGLVPLAPMIFWSIRVRFSGRLSRDATAG